jgi:hypothetical protein
MPMETNTKDNLNMAKRMAKVFTTKLMEVNTRVNIKMVK